MPERLGLHRLPLGLSEEGLLSTSEKVGCARSPDIQPPGSPGSAGGEERSSLPPRGPGNCTLLLCGPAALPSLSLVLGGGGAWPLETLVSHPAPSPFPARFPPTPLNFRGFEVKQTNLW